MEWLERFLVALIGGGIALFGSFVAHRARNDRVNQRLASIEAQVRIANRRMIIVLKLIAESRHAEGTDRRIFDDALIRFIAEEDIHDKEGT